MNIDKFGHHVHKRLRLPEVCELNDKTLLRTENGDFDLKSSRLKGVANPLSSDDAVNKQYIDELIQKYYEKTNIDSLLETIYSRIRQIMNQLKLNFYTKREIDAILNHARNGERTSRERDP